MRGRISAEVAFACPHISPVKVAALFAHGLVAGDVRNRGPENEKGLADMHLLTLINIGGVDGTRTRDPRRDRPVF
jgi:hypothetical protein